MRLALVGVLCLAVCSALGAEVTTYKDCSSGFRISRVSVEPPCKMRQSTCVLEPKRTYTLSIDFIPDKEVTSLDKHVKFVSQQLKAQHTLEREDACAKTKPDNKCPLHSGQSYTYEDKIAIPGGVNKIAGISIWQFFANGRKPSPDGQELRSADKSKKGDLCMMLRLLVEQ